jgi:hypothetical protein
MGVEKLTHPDKMRSFAAFAGAMDVDELNAMIESLQHAISWLGMAEVSDIAARLRSRPVPLRAAADEVVKTAMGPS